MEWHNKNRHKYLLQYHIIFVCKYRKKLLTKTVKDDIILLSKEICDKHLVDIIEVNTNLDHIHYILDISPNISISKIIALIKQYTTFHIWGKHPKYLYKHFWKEKTFWSDGYFACSVGNVSRKTLEKYIQNQG